MQKNKVVTILLLTAVIILSIVNVVSYNRLNNHKVDSKEKFMIRKIQAKEFKEIEIGFNCLNTDVYTG